MGRQKKMKNRKRKLTGGLILMFLLMTIFGMAFSVSAASVDTTATEIDSDTVWYYWDDEDDPAEGYSDRTVWTTASYSVSGWDTGQCAFGAKNGTSWLMDSDYPIETKLDQYKSWSTKCIEAYFFRTVVTIDDPEDVVSIVGKVIYDDSATIYINGTRVAGFEDDEITENMEYGGGTVDDYDDPRTAAIEITDEDTIQDVLVEGENIIAVEVHQRSKSSSDIYFDMPSLQFMTEDDDSSSDYQSRISLSVGEDETSRNITWYSVLSGEGTVTVAEYSEVSNNKMPSDATTYTVTGTASENMSGYYIYQTTMDNLEEGVTYAYQVSNKGTKSDIYTFTTGEDDNEFSFAVAGDPQIGAGLTTSSDEEGWEETLDTIASESEFDGIDFLLSVGDQVDECEDEDQYEAFLEHDLLYNLPIVTVIGNHDRNSIAFSEHFNYPNDSVYGSSTGGNDYYFVYENVLFMVLNSNNTSTAEHKAFMEEAIEATADQDISWKVVTFHHSIYSVAYHAVQDSIIERREELVPVFEELDIDVVLMGHDHVYCRTYMMDEFDPVTDTDEYDDTDYSSITNTDDILYVTFNSASGSKYYIIQSGYDFEYAAVMKQNYSRNISLVNVSDTEFTVTTYKASDMSEIDTFSIYRSECGISVDATEGGTASASAETGIYGDEISLTAEAEEGYTFIGWTVNSGDITISDDNTFTMPGEAVSVTAEFEKITYDITVEDSENGTVTPSAKTASLDDEITLTVDPDDGYHLEEIGAVDSEGTALEITEPAEVAEDGAGDYTFTMPASDVTVTAVFAKDEYSITVEDAENGTVDASVEDSSGEEQTEDETEDSSGDESADETEESEESTVLEGIAWGETVTVTVDPDEDYHLSTLTVTDADGNTVETEKQEIESEDGDEDTDGTDESDEADMAETYTFTMPASDVTVTAVFAKDEYSVTVESAENGTVDAAVEGSGGEEQTEDETEDSAGDESADETEESEESTVLEGIAWGETVTVTVDPDEDYHLSTLTVTDADGNTVETEKQEIESEAGDEDTDGTDESDEADMAETYTFTMPAGDVTVTAVFVKDTYEISIGETDNGSVTSDPSGEAEWDATVTLTPEAEEGYHLDSISAVNADEEEIELAENTEDGSWSFTMPKSTATVTAVFAKDTYDVIVEDVVGGSVSADLAADVEWGTTVTLTPAADEGYSFDTLTASYEDGTAVELTENTEDGSWSFTMPQNDVTVTAAFSKISYSVIVSEIENGTVTLSADTAVVDDVITLTAEAGDGYHLEEISVAESDGTAVEVTEPETETDDGSETCTFTMPASDVTVTAVFAKDTYDVTVEEAEGGSVVADPSTDVEWGTTVTLTPEADDGYYLASITITGVDDVDLNKYEDGSVSFMMPQNDVTVTAVFVKDTYEISIREFDGGSVTSDPSVESEWGETVTVAAEAADGYSFVSLTVLDEDGNEVETTEEDYGIYSFTMPKSNVTVTAEFAEDEEEDSEPENETEEETEEATYALIIGEFDGGSVESDPDEKAEAGTAVTLTPETEEGYHLDSISAADADGESVELSADSEKGTYSFTMPASDVTVTAVFAKDIYEISTGEISGGSVTSDPSGESEWGETVTVEAEAAEGYSFVSLTVLDEDGNEVALTEEEYGVYSFTMPDSSVTVTAEFAEDEEEDSEPENETEEETEEATYTLSIGEFDGGSVESDPDGEAEAYTAVTLTPEAEEGYHLDSISAADADGETVELTEDSENGTWSFTMPQSEVTVTAEFEKDTYDVTVDESAGGSVTAEPDSDVEWGTEVIITAEAEEGYSLTSLMAVEADDEDEVSLLEIDAEESGIELTENDDGTWSFTMPMSDVTVSAVFEKAEQEDSNETVESEETDEADETEEIDETEETDETGGSDATGSEPSDQDVNPDDESAEEDDSGETALLILDNDEDNGNMTSDAAAAEAEESGEEESAEVKDNTQTADSNAAGMWIVLVIIAGAVIAGVPAYRRKVRNE